MTTFRSAVDTASPEYTAAAEAMATKLAEVEAEFAKAIAGCVPELGKEALYWRLDFLSGALTYAMADFGLIKRPSGVTETSHRSHAAEELIRFAAAGLRADPVK